MMIRCWWPSSSSWTWKVWFHDHNGDLVQQEGWLWRWDQNQGENIKRLDLKLVGNLGIGASTFYGGVHWTAVTGADNFLIWVTGDGDSDGEIWSLYETKTVSVDLWCGYAAALTELTASLDGDLSISCRDSLLPAPFFSLSIYTGSPQSWGVRGYTPCPLTFSWKVYPSILSWFPPWGVS